jgi:hypothetical protein
MDRTSESIVQEIAYLIEVLNRNKSGIEAEVLFSGV